MNKIDNYINGERTESKSARVLDVENPGTGEILARVAMSIREEVDSAVKAARRAFTEWKEVPATERVGYIFKLRNLLEEHFEDIAVSTTKEHGKTLDEAIEMINERTTAIPQQFTPLLGVRLSSFRER